MIYTTKLKPTKVARYGVDILAVYSSVNATPISLEEAIVKLHKLHSEHHKDDRPYIQKCTMNIYCTNEGSHTMLIKSQSNKTILESFPFKSFGTPQVGQIGPQSLVFLPVLSKESKSELFVFHPNTASAQEIVIKLIELQQLKERSHENSSSSFQRRDLSDIGKVVENNHNSDDVPSEYSLSSSFFNNWYSQIGNIAGTAPNSLYHGSCGADDELHLLNSYMRNIRGFVNNLYTIMHKAIPNSGKQKTHSKRVLKLPSKTSFIEIVREIKSSLNIVAANQRSVVNPPFKEIVNELMLILRIFRDATTDNVLLLIRDPPINNITAKYLVENLTPANQKFWISLGDSYGYIENTNPGGLRVINEFQIKKVFLSPNYERDNSCSSERSIGRPLERSTGVSSDWVPDSNFDISGERIYERNHGRDNTQHLNNANDIHADDLYGRSKIHRSDDSQRLTPHLPPHPGILMHQRSDSRSRHNYDCDIHSNRRTWHDRQCAFIDQVLQRNGRLIRITKDKVAHNPGEISVSCNEFVEMLTDNGDTFSAQNAIGEVGCCPSSIAIHVPPSSK